MSSYTSNDYITRALKGVVKLKEVPQWAPSEASDQLPQSLISEDTAFSVVTSLPPHRKKSILLTWSSSLQNSWQTKISSMWWAGWWPDQWYQILYLRDRTWPLCWDAQYHGIIIWITCLNEIYIKPNYLSLMKVLRKSFNSWMINLNIHVDISQTVWKIFWFFVSTKKQLLISS